MINQLANTLFYCAAIFIVAGCYTPRYVYSPAAHNVPVIAKKKDSKLGFNYSSNLPGTRTIDGQVFRARSHGFDIHGAYALGNKFAMQANYFSRSEKNGGNYSTTQDSAVIRYSRGTTEVGFGYYTRMSSGSTLMFQVFTGLGIGNFNFTDNGKDQNRNSYSRYHWSRILKFYIQPAFQYQGRKKISASLSSRFSVINFHNVKTDYTAQELANFELHLLTNSPVVFWEPAFVNSFGFTKLPGFWLEYQAGLSLLMSRRFIDARSFNFSMGIVADLPKLLKKKAEPAKKGSAINL